MDKPEPQNLTGVILNLMSNGADITFWPDLDGCVICKIRHKAKNGLLYGLEVAVSIEDFEQLARKEVEQAWQKIKGDNDG